MGDPANLRAHEVEIFVTRELRKSGLAVSGLRTRATTPLARSGQDFVVELRGTIRFADGDHPILIECRNQREPIAGDALQAMRSHLQGDGRQRGIMFSTSGYEPDAIRAARVAGIAALTVSDGKLAFMRSASGMAGQPPAWVPEYMSEVVDLDAQGQLRHVLVVAGRPELILDRLTEPASPSS